MPNSKPDASAAHPKAASPTALVQESAQQIWLAGLGAFAKAQEEGTKAFQSLVKEGLSLQRQTKVAAEMKLAEASSRIGSLAGVTTGLTAGLSSLGAQAAQPWDRLEGIFEARVAKALAPLGLPSRGDFEALKAAVAALQERLVALEMPAGRPTRKAATSAKATPKAKGVSSPAKPAKPVSSVKTARAVKTGKTRPVA